MVTEPNFILTPDAKWDLAGIARYTKDEHGAEQEVIYIERLFQFFEMLVAMPNYGKPAPRGMGRGIKKALFDAQYHVYYRVVDRQIRILGVIHGSRRQFEAMAHRKQS